MEVGVVGTLLGPEGAGPPEVDGDVRRGGVGGPRVGAVRVSVPPAVVRALCGVRRGGVRRKRVRVVAGWSLRIVQWTRASSFEWQAPFPVPAARAPVCAVAPVGAGDAPGCGLDRWWGGVCCRSVAKLLRAHGGCLGTRSR